MFNLRPLTAGPNGNHMNFEKPSSQTLANYDKLIRLLTNLNELNNPILSRERFSWGFQRDILYIHGIPESLANLFALLWAHTENYAFYMFQDNWKSFIQVLYIPQKNI